VHDVEDGVHSGFIRIAELDDDTERAALCEQTSGLYSTLSATDLAPALDRVLALPALRDLAQYDGSHTAQASAKRATSELTGRFAGAAVAATRAQHPGMALGRYRADLVVPAEVAAECALLKGISYRYVMRRTGIDATLVAQRRILTELVEALCAAASKSAEVISPSLRPDWRLAADDNARLRVVIDQVAQLTDSSASSWHERFVRA
jgi:dGTPase